MRIGILLSLLAAPALAANVHGLGRAKDGDSLYVGQREVRLFGIDAPEFDQFCERDGQQWACGQRAMEQLRALVSGRDVSCTSMGQDDFGRMLGRCTVNGMDVNQRMVELGLAVAYRHYSADYVPAEERAKAARAGIWAGTFQMPYEYRLGPSDRPQQAVRSGCNIKGNRGSNGWIYHMPGQKYYEVTKAEEMFCSEADAQAAGYRKARTR